MVLGDGMTAATSRLLCSGCGSAHAAVAGKPPSSRGSNAHNIGRLLCIPVSDVCSGDLQ
jgi:hypothetical protein